MTSLDKSLTYQGKIWPVLLSYRDFLLMICPSSFPPSCPWLTLLVRSETDSLWSWSLGSPCRPWIHLSIAYQVNNKCFGGTIACHDLVLLTCKNKRYIVKKADLEQCLHGQTTVLCPANVLSTVENPFWLGLKWTPQSKIPFSHSHTPWTNCHTLRPLVHLDGRYFLLGARANISIHTNNGSKFSVIAAAVYLSFSMWYVLFVPTHWSGGVSRMVLFSVPFVSYRSLSICFVAKSALTNFFLFSHWGY